MDAKQVKNVKISEDKISALPDEILSFILSFLRMKEAARTSILSHRWKYLWKTCVASSSTIDLDVLAMKGCDYPKEIFEDCKNGKASSFLQSEMCKFAGFVDYILQLDHCPVKYSFRLRFYLDNGFTHHIDQWIAMAITMRCQKLDIDLSHFHPLAHGVWEGRPYYVFPSLFPTQETGSSVKCLSLKSCIIGSLDSNVFSSLIDLQLNQVSMNNDTVANILFNCPILEKLCLVCCRKLSILEVSGPSLRLKYLTIISSEIQTININAKNLTRLRYSGYPVEFRFLDAPQLSRVIIHSCHEWTALTRYALEELSEDIHQLESLLLSVVPIKEEWIPKPLPLFPNLRELVLLVTTLGETLWGFIPLLQASPYLRRLELHILLWLISGLTIISML